MALCSALCSAVCSAVCSALCSALCAGLLVGCVSATPPKCKTGNCGTDASVPAALGLHIEPASATLTVQGGPAKQPFVALLNGADVTSSCTFTLEKAAGAIDATGLFTSNYPLVRGGSFPITATCKGQIASAGLVLDYVSPDVITKGAPADAAAAFGGAPSMDPAAAPTIIYPFDGSMLPRNETQLDIQWSAPAAASLFRLHLVGGHIDSTFYVGGGACQANGQKWSCRYQPSTDDFRTIALTSAGTPITLSVSSTSGPNQPVADATSVTLHLSPEDVKGGFYWFSPSIRGLKRLPFGATAATDFVSFTQGSGNCAGCHAVSRDGKKVAATFYGGDGTGGAVDGANGQKYLIRPEPGSGKAVQRWNFATFSPDGTLLLTNWAGVLTLRDGTTGARKFDLPSPVTGGPAVMPEWSPDGKHVAFVQLGPDGKLGRDIAPGSLQAGDFICGNAGHIATIDFDNGTFSNPQVIVPAVSHTEYSYYPSWSPDSQWILFVTARYPGHSPTADSNLFGASSKGYAVTYDQDSARLRLVQAMPGATPIELTNATHQANKTTSWPKFAPFIQSTGNLVFFTFSAKFDYGFVVTDGVTPQLWMSAIDLERARQELGGTDPSYPPFWLPFQDPTEKNHSGIWTSDVACVQDADCPVEFTCQNGACAPNIPG